METENEQGYQTDTPPQPEEIVTSQMSTDLTSEKTLNSQLGTPDDEGEVPVTNEVVPQTPPVLFPGADSTLTNPTPAMPAPEGPPAPGAPDGPDAPLNGPDFSLDNRKAERLPKPNIKVQEQGKIVVKITVDRNGKVLEASAGQQGTTLINKQVWEKVEASAKEAEFNMDNSAPELQYGTITYFFNITK